MRKRYLLASDFDQTLSFDDSGYVLSDMLGIGGFANKVAGLSRLNLVQEGAELTYLLRHDPEYRRVRREHLTEVGQRIRLKRNIGLLIDLLERGIDGLHFEFYVVSAAPEEVVHSALRGLVPADHIVATQLSFNEQSGEVESVVRVAAGYGKVAAVDELRARLSIPGDRVVYVGDGTSDLHVMLHVNRGDGLTIAASEARQITQVARRTVMSDDALSVLIPILEDIGGCTRAQIRQFFESHGQLIQDWDRVRTDWLTIADRADVADAIGA
ncbi:MAG: haloacid dehalogenase-like hydrolase [Gemmatimonadaceae bacterium]